MENKNPISYTYDKLYYYSALRRIQFSGNSEIEEKIHKRYYSTFDDEYIHISLLYDYLYNNILELEYIIKYGDKSRPDMVEDYKSLYIQIIREQKINQLLKK